MPLTTNIDDFLRPLYLDLDTAHSLSQLFLQNFQHLAAECADQFLPTPITESVLRPRRGASQGCHLAIDIGGTNLRVGFVEVLTGQGAQAASDDSLPNGSNGTNSNLHHVRRLLEKSWPIDDHLKNENSESLFLWIGKCIAEVVGDGCETLQLPRAQAIPLGVTFSFPMVQHSLSEATLMSMGKGFAISSNLNLGSLLVEGYRKSKTADLPDIRVDAIANDSVSTLVSFIFQYNESRDRKAAMGLILGTGCNATIPLRLSQLHQSKQPRSVGSHSRERDEDIKITVNTEWSIKGTAPPLRELNLVSSWDRLLDSQNETPGFQPLEYMTAGRYLGELGRIMLVDYMTSHMGYARESLPPRLFERHSLTTTFLSHFKPLRPPALVKLLEQAFPGPSFAWTEELATALYHMAKAIEVRAAGIVAAAILALLTLAGELPAESEARQAAAETREQEVGVGYTGGCIVHFQDYLEDCQAFVDGLVEKRYGRGSRVKVVLSPCHDGGITGAGILVAAATASVKE